MNRLTQDLHLSLKRLEWAGNDNNGQGPYCLACNKKQSESHSDECHIGKALDQYTLVEQARKLLEG